MTTLTAILFALGFFLLIFGADFLVRGASSLAVTVGISPLVVGLTVVAYGTSAPELAVTMLAMYGAEPQPDIAVGNVVGSNIANLLFVLGLAASVRALVVSPAIVWWNAPLMVLVSGVMVGMSYDGVIERWEAAVLVVGAIGYTWLEVYLSRKKTKELARLAAEVEDLEVEPVTSWLGAVWQVGSIVLGLVMLVVGAQWLVDGAVEFARWINVSELVIGLTIVAVGTSLPEVATSAVAAYRGETDIAVGNVVGSNTFNVLFVVGVTGVAAPLELVVSPSALAIDMPVMMVVSLAVLPVFFSRYVVQRWQGALLLTFFVLYTVYRYLEASGAAVASPFGTVTAFVLAPAAILLLLISATRFAIARRQS